MPHLLKPRLLFSSYKNISDIIKNYTHLSGCDRVQQIAQEAYLSVTDNHNGEHYSKLTDLLSFAAAKMMYQRMSTHETGIRILQEKPRITDDIYKGLGELKEGTFGKEYYNFMNGLSFKPSSRPLVRYIADLQYAYVLQRYKEIHDFLHVLMAKQISVDQQLVLKWFEMRQLRLPSATLASLISPFMSSNFNLSQISNIIRIADKAEFVMNIYYEQHFSQPAVMISQIRTKFVKNLDFSDQYPLYTLQTYQYQKLVIINIYYLKFYRQTLPRRLIIIFQMGIQQNIQRKLGIPIAHILDGCQPIQSNIKLSILNIFDAGILKKIVLQFLPASVHVPQNYITDQPADYNSVWKILKEAAKQSNISIKHQRELTKKFLNKQKIDYEQETIGNITWVNLRTLCDVIFHLMLKNESVLYVITKMDEKYQIQIKQYIENNQEQDRIQTDSPVTYRSNNKIMSHQQNDLLDKIYELQHSLHLKDQQLAKNRQKLNEKKEQLLTIKTIFQQKQAQIGQLKKRIVAYAQADVLFQQKDQQIAKLNMELSQLKIKSHVKNNELNNELIKLRQKISQLQAEKHEITAINQQLVSKNQMLTLSKQQTDSTNKKVIANLKQKIKTLNERLSGQQKNLMDVLIQKQQKQKQIFELQKKATIFDTAKKSKIITRTDDLKYSGRKSSKLVDQLGEIAGMLQNEQNNLKYFQILFGDMSTRCTGELCIALRSEYVRFIQQILKINNDLQTLQYITPKNRLECILNNINRIQECHHQNTKLKQKIILIQSEGNKGTSKESLQQINKLKKKILVLKRNIEEIQSKKKDQIQILISVLSQKFVADKKA